jgi:hypothetical protein
MDDWTSNQKIQKSWIFNTRSMSKIQESWIFGFLLDYWIGLNWKHPIQSNNPKIQKSWIFGVGYGWMFNHPSNPKSREKSWLPILILAMSDNCQAERSGWPSKLNGKTEKSWLTSFFHRFFFKPSTFLYGVLVFDVQIHVLFRH